MGVLMSSLSFCKKLFSYPGRLIALTILDVIPLLNLIAVGYYCEIAREGSNIADPPALRNIGSLFIQGIKVVIVTTIYNLVPLALVFPLMSIRLGLPLLPRFFYYESIILFIIGVIVFILINEINFIAIVHMLRNKAFSKAFAISEIKIALQKISKLDYALFLLFMYPILLICLYTITINYLWWLITVAITPFLATFFCRSLGIIYEGHTDANKKMMAASSIVVHLLSY